uniref:Putative secreted protein n=1 Tax=Anopheles darlingi TaxID=43151 RepID=A0A2M4DHQ7_ANODA
MQIQSNIRSLLFSLPLSPGGLGIPCSMPSHRRLPSEGAHCAMTIKSRAVAGWPRWGTSSTCSVQRRMRPIPGEREALW